ncbi:Uncharacterised protein [Serratia ficaria]|nr:Uncharacterised protein [Serratia ficaria]CAI2430600.1 Uncharacterised protein [Serratia ficaria]
MLAGCKSYEGNSMNKIMGLIANKIIDILRGKPALKVGNVSVWGSFTTDEKERFRRLLLDSQIAKAKDQKLEERIAELEAKLATPVQLQNCDFGSVAIMAHWCTDEQLEAWVKGVEHAKKQIRAAGFKVEGDE